MSLLARTLPWLVPLVLAASGCSRVLGLPDRHLDREPEGSELVGSWRLTAGSRASLEREGFSRREHALELDPSGSCRFRSFWALGTPATEYLADAECAWRVARGTAYIRHREARVPVVALELRRADHLWQTSLFVTEQEGRLVLWSYVGDPDARVYADWVRADRPAGLTSPGS